MSRWNCRWKLILVEPILNILWSKTFCDRYEVFCFSLFLSVLYFFPRQNDCDPTRNNFQKVALFFWFRALDTLRTAVKKLILIFIFVSKIPVTHFAVVVLFTVIAKSR